MYQNKPNNIFERRLTNDAEICVRLIYYNRLFSKKRVNTNFYCTYWEHSII